MEMIIYVIDIPKQPKKSLIQLLCYAEACNELVESFSRHVVAPMQLFYVDLEVMASACITLLDSTETGFESRPPAHEACN